jgi:hypothetical protein
MINNSDFSCWFYKGSNNEENISIEKSDSETLKSYLQKIFKVPKIKDNIKLENPDRMDFFILLLGKIIFITPFRYTSDC